MTKNEWWMLVIGLVFLLTLLLMPAPAHAESPAYCYRSKTGVVCVQTGGSGITVVRRVWKH